MSRYLRLLGLFLLLQGAVLAALFALDRPHDNYLAASVDKARLLATSRSPRVVLVGGSNLAFGIDSRLIASGLGGRYTPVNLGLHAGLGLQFELNEALRGVRRGDIVVLSPEYHPLWSNTMATYTLLPMLAYWPLGVLNVPRNDWPRLAAHSPDDGLALTAHDMAERLYNKVHVATIDRLKATTKRLAGSSAQQEADSAYTRDGFDPFGDETTAWSATSHYLPGALKPAARPFPAAGLHRSVTAIQEFVAACRTKGVRVAYDYPPIPEAWYQVNKPEIERTAQTLESSLRIPFINSPATSVYPTQDFFDTMDHLRGHAVQLRTTRLTKSLQRLLAQ